MHFTGKAHGLASGELGRIPGEGNMRALCMGGWPSLHMMSFLHAEWLGDALRAAAAQRKLCGTAGVRAFSYVN